MRLTAVLLVISTLTILAAEALQLKIKPSGDKFVKSLGSSILFTCEVSGAKGRDVRIRWLDKLSNEITENPGRRVYVEQSDTLSKKLYITNIENKDVGRYQCVAASQSEREDRSVELIIYKEITFDHVPNPQHPAINTLAVIECKVSGFPEPEVSWRYNGRPLETGNRYTKLKDGLRIADITPADDGNYTCRAEVENEGRYDERRITVAVHIPPHNITGPGTVEEVEGRDVSLTCRADGLPPPKFEFYKNNRVLLSNDRINVDADAGKITFRPLTKEDEGEYTCKAHNDVGVRESRGRLHVLVPPRIYELHNITRSELESGTLLCRSFGHPSPEMYFQKEGIQFPYQIGSNENGRISILKRGVGQLEMTIRDLSPSDAANYTCFSNNSAGRDNKTAVIDVHFKPRFGNDSKTLVYSWAGARHNMTCNVLAQPMPTIKWVRFGRKLESNETFQIFTSERQSNLQVRIREADQSRIYGDYFCEAENLKGKNSLRIQLNRATVPDKPQRVHSIEISPNQVILKVEPPRENGGVSVIGYRVEFDSNIQDVSVRETSEVRDDDRHYRNWYKNVSADRYLGTELSIDNLRPGTKYIFKIRAKNEVGVGSSVEHLVITANLTKPYPIKLNSPRISHFSYEYHVTWAPPKTGGLPIEAYEFKYRKVKNLSSDDSKSLKSNDWITKDEPDNPKHPIRAYTIRNLAPKTEYQLVVIAKNELGASQPNDDFFFSTSDVNPSEIKSHAVSIIFSFVGQHFVPGFQLSLVISTFILNWAAKV